VIGRRRFWTEVAVAPAADGFEVRLDGRPLNTPAQAPLRLPTRALAEAVAAEWRAVEGDLRPEALPFTRAANVALDRVPQTRAAVVAAVAAYGDSDLLCYRAAAPAALRRRQAAAWDPPLAWAAAALGAPLATAEGVIHRPQPPASLAALRASVAAADDFALTALHELVALSGSLVLALAVARGALDPVAAWALARLDETWQAELWGEDAEAAAAAARRRAAFLRAARMLEMLAAP
jgi:chaperone required for assembly of F1-ATPase